MSARRILLLGHPVTHSLSPAFQQAAFDAVGLPVRYEAMDVAPADLSRLVAELRADPLVLGANVTLPHKEKIAPLLDSLTDDAEQIGAVNTVTRAGSRLVGRNTDVAGFRGVLDSLLDGRRTPRHALILGAGGAAKAAISALVTAGVVQISIANRHLARAERLVGEVRRSSPHLTVRAAPWHEGLLVEEAQIAGLVVHATTLGLSDAALPLPAAAFRAGQFVIDVVYAPGETALVRAARAAGAEAIDGREMLLLQGAAAFELWTGRPAPIEVMRAAFEAATGHTQK
ncbi:MAG: shikimate dehydrogenase [bacterium]|nr:shikimate dehydrogenase [Candidatus Aquidulcis sp.]